MGGYCAQAILPIVECCYWGRFARHAGCADGGWNGKWDASELCGFLQIKLMHRVGYDEYVRKSHLRSLIVMFRDASLRISRMFYLDEKQVVVGYGVLLSPFI